MRETTRDEIDARKHNGAGGASGEEKNEFHRVPDEAKTRLPGYHQYQHKHYK